MSYRYFGSSPSILPGMLNTRSGDIGITGGVSFDLPGTGRIDIFGNPVGTPEAGLNTTDEIMAWIKQNPLLALGGAALLVYAVKK